MKKFIGFLIIFIVLTSFNLPCDGGKCSGGKYCSACKNCKYCKHCNAGGVCGVCSPESFVEKPKAKPVVKKKVVAKKPVKNVK